MDNRNVTFVKAVQLVRGEYLEIPGLCLTQRQVERLWGFDEPTAETVLRALVEAGFLRQTPGHAYARAQVCEPASDTVPAVERAS